MKFVVGIILVAVLVGGLIAYLIFMLNAHEMIYCGDVTNSDGTNTSVTQVYTTDLSANQTLAEIIKTMNETEGDTVTVQELTDVLATYQNIIYAPVFTVSAEQLDTQTFIITGHIYNGLTDEGEPAQTDYIQSNLRLNAITTNGTVLCAENVYDDGTAEAAETPVLTERNNVVDPIIYGADTSAGFAFTQSDSFRMIVKTEQNSTADISLVYTYDVISNNPLDFTQIDNGALGIELTLAFDSNGFFAPTYQVLPTTAVTEQPQ